MTTNHDPGRSYTRAELEDRAAELMSSKPPHQCDNCGGIDPGSCAMNPEGKPPENEAATNLARYIGDQPVSTLQAAFRLLGWDLEFERYDAEEEEQK